MSQPKTKVLLFGLGAIGGFYAFVLSRSENVSVSVIARSNYDSVKKDGLKIESQNHGTHKVHFDGVYKSPSDAAGETFDYIVCAHKAVNPSAIPPLFKSVVSDSTTFVIIQNGVGNEDPFRELYPNCSIISCVTWVGAKQPTPGTVTHTKAEDMQMGLFPNSKIDNKVEKGRLDKFAELLTQGKTIFQVEDNIQIKRWEKVVWNAAWNPLTTLTNTDTETWMNSSPDAVPITRQLMKEVIDVARRCDVPIKYELIDELFEKIKPMGAIGSSMQNDMRAGNALEVDVIVGTPLKRAKEFGMDVPVLKTIATLTVAVNARIVGARL
ncbi:hypothetical protein MBLNU230_g3886t1 [Neophaeotheca triangularis]